jgi:serine/threonine protein kinase
MSDYTGTAAAPARIPCCSTCGQPLSSAAATPGDSYPTPEPSGIFASNGPSLRFTPGTLLAGRYRIAAFLGQGGMGEVYRADDLTLEQPVALKFLPDPLLQNRDALGRFHREVRLARQIAHPNVCRVFDIGAADGRIFIAMEFVDGEDLDILLRRIGRLAPGKAMDVARQLCDGLASAHDAGVLHRDLKPANVMLDSKGKVRITDFGLAALVGESGYELNAGTPAYMAPEQIAQQAVSVRSDIYALGLLLYEVFTGNHPFPSKPLADILLSPELRLSLDMSEVSPQVQEVIRGCLQPEPDKRLATVRQVAALFSACLAEARPGARSERELSMEFTKQNWAWPGAAGPLKVRLAWSLVMSTMIGLALLLILGSRITGRALEFSSHAADSSTHVVYTWLWCLSLQVFLALLSMVWLLRSISAPSSAPAGLGETAGTPARRP